MSVDFTKFPYPRIERPDAPTLTEAITVDPVDSGFVVITAKATDPEAFTETARDVARLLRAGAGDSGLLEITAYRQLRREELGGAVPFDQPICEAIVARAAQAPPPQAPGMANMGSLAQQIVLGNPHANWVLLLEYGTPAQATAAARASTDGGESAVTELSNAVTEHSVGAFKNMNGYASVSRDPNVIQFFNLFPAPGDLGVLWPAWQEALPWFFEIAEFRSSFPLLALDPNQPILLVNYAHCDSTKHFLNGALHDPEFMRLMMTCYLQRNIAIPTPFFCKIVPV
jgi:hypothetical protein